jgi:integrase
VWEMAATNPWATLDLPTGGYRRDETWSVGEIKAISAAARAMGRESVAVAIEMAYAIGARIGDVLALKKNQVVKGRLTYTTIKTKEEVNMTLPLHLAYLFEGDPQAPVIVNESNGQAYHYQTFWKWWDMARKAAGLADKTFHDLRHTVATEMADGGATTLQMNAFFGWKNERMALRYTKRTVHQADAAMALRKVAS